MAIFWHFWQKFAHFFVPGEKIAIFWKKFHFFEISRSENWVIFFRKFSKISEIFQNCPKLSKNAKKRPKKWQKNGFFRLPGLVQEFT